MNMNYFIRIFISICIYLSFSLDTNAQSWLQAAGGNSQDEALAITIDNQANIITTGYFSQSARFDNFIIGSAGMGDIFVAKQNSNGDYLWVVKAGGLNSDRAYGITTSSNGDIFITGVYKGSAVFGSTTLTSINNSQDVFIAKLDANGNFIWAMSVGGDDTEIANDVDVNSTGEIVVSGQYKGNATFGAFSLSSMVYNSSMGNLAGLPSYDGYLLKADNNGNILWIKNFAAEYDDRVMKVEFDSTGMIYMCGQFSDTLNTGSIYNNNSYNAGFVLKTDENGNDVWMRRLLAPQIMVYDLKTDGTDIYITGDAKGNININTIPVTVVPAIAGDYNVYAIKMNSSGGVVWSATQYSENPLSSRSIAVSPNGEINIAGTFNCSFTQFTNMMQPALFNSVGFKDIFIIGYNGQGNRISERNYGGIGEDWPWGMEIAIAGHPIIAGSYNGSFSIPYGSGFIFHDAVDDLASDHGNTGVIVCGNSNYGNYANATGMGNKDILSSDPFDLSLPRYDYYERNTGSCQLDTLMPQLFPLSDTVAACDSTKIWIYTQTTLDYLSAPDWEFSWSTGSNNDTISILTTGWYHVEYGFKDDCRRFKDSIFVEIYTSPFTPQITCTNFNILQAIPHDGCYNKLAKMVNDSAYLQALNIYPGYDFFWTDPNGNIFTDTNITAVDFGVYTLEVTSPNGLCSRQQCVRVYDYMSAGGSCSGLLNGTLVPMLVLTDSNFNDTDTVIVCKDDYFGVEFFDSLDFFNGDTTFMNTFIEWTILQGGFAVQFPMSAQYTFRYHHQEYRALASGNCSLMAEVLHPVTHQTLITVFRNFYLDVHEAPPNNPVISGPNSFCPGDTVLLTVSGGSEYTWGGPGIVQINAPANDSILIVMEGVYGVNSITRDSVMDCPKEVGILYNVASPAAPSVMMFPSHGVVCPNDSVLLTAVAGSNYEWYGPTGSVISNSSSVWVTVPGFYHYTFYTPNGCELTSNMAEVLEYSTPFLEADPGTNLCAGGTVTITVESNEMSLVNWLSPLSGSTFSQVVNAPGIYQASVNFCNITTVVDIEITQSTLNAEILYSGNDTICPGEEIILITDAVGASINWLPGNESGSVFVPQENGPFILELIDAGGCIDYDTLSLNYFTAPPSPLVSDTMVCGSDSILITAQSSNTIYWQDTNDTLIATGDSLMVFVQNSDTAFNVLSYDGVCFSDAASMTIQLFSSALLPEIFGDSIVCIGDTLFLSTDSIAGFNYYWSGPGNFSDSTYQTYIATFNYSNEGVYTLFVGDSQCQSPVAEFEVFISDPQLQSIAGAQFICSGDSILISDTLVGNYLWQDGSTDDLYYADTDGNYFFTFENSFGCIAQSDTMQLVMVVPSPLIVAMDTSVCAGASLVLISDAGNSMVTWNEFDQGIVLIGDTMAIDPVINGYNFIVTATDSMGCSSITDTVTVTLLPQEPAPVITMEDTICAGSVLFLSTTSSGNLQWFGPNGFSSTNNTDSISPVTLANAGTYSVFSMNGSCISDTASMDLMVISLPELSLSPDVSICFGDSTELIVSSTDVFYWSDFSTASSIMVSPDSTQWYFVFTTGYCGTFSDSVLVTVNPLPDVELGPDQTILLGLGTTLSISDGVDFNWTPSTGLDCDDCSSVLASPIEETEYFVTVIDSLGCVNSDSITIYVDNQTTCFIPNSFTPNGDGVNDVFQPMIYGLDNYQIRIFDRWGEIIFESNNGQQGWDGLHKGTAVQEGTYVYQISGFDLDAEERRWEGHLNLIR